jgi:glycosyltransferase involved in cell wall biosynthesis
MAENRRIFVVVPAYNEASALRTTLDPLLARGYSVVVVDDGSSDGTFSIAAGLPLHALRHAVNLGQGAALETGTIHALDRGAEVVVHFDADGQHAVEDVDALVAPILLGEADIVFGSRFLRTADRERVPRLKRLLLRAAVIFSGLMTGVWLSDAHNGFRALSRSAAARIRLRENGFAHATEILSQVRAARLRWLERPTTVRYTGYSKAKGQPAVNSLSILLDLMLRRLFR